MNKQDYLRIMESRLISRSIDRRQFMRGVLATGITVSAATMLANRAEAATPKKGGSLTAGLGHGATSDTLDPGLLAAGFLIPLGLAMNGYLTEIDANNEVQPSLAESWDVSDDASVWRFKLRNGVEFHNGKTLSADDVVASVNHHRGENTTSAAAPLLAGVRDIRVDGSDVVVFELEAGNADFPAALSDYHIAIMPAVDGKMDWQSGIGSGAYRLDEFDPGVAAKLSRHRNHWTDAAGHVDEWRLLVLLDTNARMTAALTGDVDVADKIDVKTAGRLAGNPNLNVHSVAGTQHYSFPMLTNRAPFDDNNIRQAIKWGIDREELLEKILFGYGSVGNDHPIGSGQKYFNSELEQKTIDPDKAKYFLKQAGLDSLDVELSASDAAFPGAIDAAQLIQNSAAKSGINVKVVREPNDGYWSDVWLKKPWCASYWAGRPVEDLMFSLAFKSGVSWNESLWSHEKFDALLVEARAELDQEKRRDMYWEMQDIVSNQGGVAIPMFASYVFATRPSVGTPEVMGSNLDLDGSSFMQRWWKEG
ncbi:ABC transporter substrate-binding protein [Roseibium sp. MMSF_3544]|uniref:ABC transporter substrate-binding protein n=1 Tax=unclassified Roseibium TaxID=2629323 RepID=UPI00273E7F1E|nr:ABC transporter substrate-binding protein [Roseibium sp. MMSF_3544]